MLRFRLRTLLIAVAVLAVPMAWVGYSINWIRERHAAIESGNAVHGAPPAADKYPELPFTLRVFGEQEYLAIARPRDSALTLEQLKQLFPEAKVWQISASVSPLEGHKSLDTMPKTTAPKPPPRADYWPE